MNMKKERFLLVSIDGDKFLDWLFHAYPDSFTGEGRPQDWKISKLSATKRGDMCMSLHPKESILDD